MNPGVFEHRLEIERTTEPHAVHHHVGHRIVVVERDLGDRDATDLLRLCRQQERELIRAEPGKDPGGVERRVSRLGRRLHLVTPFGRVIRRRIYQAGRSR